MTTVTITLAGVTRTVELEPRRGEVAYVRGVVATIGRGAARYPATLTLWAIQAGARPGTYPHRATAVRSGFGVATDSNGCEWAVVGSDTVRNRQARIVGWAESQGVTNRTDQTRITA